MTCVSDPMCVYVSTTAVYGLQCANKDGCQIGCCTSPYTAGCAKCVASGGAPEATEMQR